MRKDHKEENEEEYENSEVKEQAEFRVGRSFIKSFSKLWKEYLER